MRLAIVGALLENLPVRATEMGPWHVAPLVDTLRPVVAEAKQRADLVVVLAHIRIRDAEAILEQLPDVAIVVFGHPHDGLEKPLERDGRLGVQASGYGRDVGRLRLKYDTEAAASCAHEWARLPWIRRQIPADPAVDREVQAWESKVAAVVDVPIGRSTKAIDRHAGRMIMQRALLDRFKADAAFIEGGSVRDEIPEGALLARHIWNMSPFQDPAVTVTLSGPRAHRIVSQRRQTAAGRRRHDGRPGENVSALDVALHRARLDRAAGQGVSHDQSKTRSCATSSSTGSSSAKSSPDARR